MSQILQQLARGYDDCVAALGVGTEWAEFPDLFTFLRDLGFTAMMNTLCGPELMKQSPHFGEAFWLLDTNVHFLHMGFPEWLNPAVVRAREDCLQAITKERRFAVENLKGKSCPDDLMWDEIWGSKLMRSRNRMYARI